MQLRRNNLNLIPYTQINGEWTIPDDLIMGLFDKMVADGNYQTFYLNAAVKSREKFLKTCKNPVFAVHIIVRDDGVPVTLWVLQGTTNNFAYVHICGFEGATREEKLESAHMSKDYWFSLERDGKPILDVLIGIFPETNKSIKNFAVRAGWKVLGTIPRILYDYWQGKQVGGTYCYVARGA